MVSRAFEIRGLLYINTQILYFAYRYSQKHQYLDVLIGLHKKLFLGPILKQQDFLTIITISSISSSYSQIFSNLSSIQTDGAINKISSAYKTINMRLVRRGDLVRSSKYIAKRNGDRTEPCLTPKLIIKRHGHASYHLTHE